MPPDSTPPPTRGAARGLALFDIDGTLTTADTMFAFARHAVGQGRVLLALVVCLPWLVLMKLGLADRGTVKGRLLAVAFAGRSREELEEAAESFARTAFPLLLRPRGLDAIQTHREAGDRILLVSASLDLWLAPWARLQGLELLCTPTRWERGRFMGLAGPNCRGGEKVERVLAHLDERPARVVAYGDSSGDIEMLAWADEGHLKPFHGGREGQGG